LIDNKIRQESQSSVRPGAWHVFRRAGWSHVNNSTVPPDIVGNGQSVLPGGQLALEEPDMTKKREKKTASMPKKTYWHLYSLQNVQTEKLVVIINKILRSEYQLIK
jgi:hypothetical protein